MKRESVLLLLMPVFAMALTIDKESGGYHDVLVAIEESVEPNEALVEAIKALLRAASSSLHRATGGRVHLASVTLAVPRHWPRRPGAQQVPHDPWSRADIRIVNDGPRSPWPKLRAPSALHAGACGQRGEHVLLPLAALPTNWSSDETASAAGNEEIVGVVSLSERFGKLFVECNPKYINFISHNSGCLCYTGYQLAREWARYRYGVLGEFATAEDIWYPEDSCNGTSPGTCANNSIDAAGVLQRVDQPCDRMSTWQLITSSDDFKGLHSLKNNEPNMTTFREIQQNISIGRHLVIIFDVSYTKKDAASLAAFKEAIASVLIDELDDGALVSLVYFVNGSSLHSGPVTLNKATRSAVTNRLLELPMEGPTCTLCGLRLTLQLLSSAHGQSSEGSLVVLFSDGKALEAPPSSAEGNSDGFLEVVPHFQRARVFITTVAVGATASSDLEKLALETGGRTFAISDTNATAEKRSWIAVQDALLDDPDELSSEVDALRNESSALYYGTGDRRSSGLLEARTGLCFEDPVTLRVRMPEYIDSYRTALVLASLTKGLCPVVRANVRGLVFFPGNRTGQEFLLHDSGLGEDVYADDGIYTGQLTKRLVKGRYSIAVEVSNSSQTQVLDWIQNEVPKGSPTVAGERASTDSSLAGTRGHSTGAFSKTSAEHPLLVKEDMKESHVPPGKVRDLSASFGSHEGRPTARLSWTMPGAHAFEGTVSSLDVRLSRSMQTMLDFFHNATAISERDLVSGSLSPLPAFSRQQATVSIPSTVIFGHNEDQAPAVLPAGHAPSASGHNVYFALVTTNADGSHSEVSNLARVFVAANLTAPAGSASALAGAAGLVPAEILVGKRDSEDADTSLPMQPLTSFISPPMEEPVTTPEVPTPPPTPPNDVTPPTEDPDTPESTTPSAEIEEESPDENIEPQEPDDSVPTTEKEENVATAEETPASTWQNEVSSAQQPGVNATETGQNATTPPIAEKKEVNKNGQEEDDDGILRAWILFAAFMVACLLICANVAFLYCRAQYEVDAGPPSPGPTSGYDTF